MQETFPSPRSRRRTPRRLAGFAVVFLLVGWAGSTLAVTWTLTRRKAPQRPEPALEVAGSERSDLTLDTPDGETLGAWLFPGRDDAPCAVVMHGNNGSRGTSRTTIELLAGKGCTVLAITLRAHGDSTGTMNDIGWSARRDVVTAVDYLSQRYPGRPIVVCGRSMSSAAAIFAAKDLGDRVSGYWLEQPYNALATATWRRLQQQLPPVLDSVAYTGMWMWSSALLPVPLTQIAPCQCVCDIPADCPLVILSGDADQHLPLADVQELFEQVRDRARLVVFRGAGHLAMPETDPALYERELDAFLERVRSRRGVPAEATPAEKETPRL